MKSGFTRFLETLLFCAILNGTVFNAGSAISGFSGGDGAVSTITSTGIVAAIVAIGFSLRGKRGGILVAAGISLLVDGTSATLGESIRKNLLEIRFKVMLVAQEAPIPIYSDI